MRKYLFILLIWHTFFAVGQEKRLALVVGNSNYLAGVLQNPVNDALLMQKTLIDLDFDVILDTNIETLVEFNKVIREFGEKRDSYDVGFIYYAGHGVQINDVNYLLPTKETFLSEFDIEDKALNIQKIMRYLTVRTNEVNVLVLDACRNNPFETTWSQKNRSIITGRGLAKISPPTGSLIAYSTEAGNTAPDGVNANSDYCLSLAKNMKIENITLDQVFRNVRADLINLSDGKQRPIESSQLTGDAFYLKKGDYVLEIQDIDNLINSGDYDSAREKIASLLTLDPNNKKGLLRKGELQTTTLGNEYDATDFLKANLLYPKDSEVLAYLARYYLYIDKNIEALYYINDAIQLKPKESDLLEIRAKIKTKLGELQEANQDYTDAVLFDKFNAERYLHRALFLQDFQNDTLNSIQDLSRAILLKPEDENYIYYRARTYFEIQDFNNAEKDLMTILKLNPINIDAINVLALIYEEELKSNEAISLYTSGIEQASGNEESAAFLYNNRGTLKAKIGLIDDATSDFTNAIIIDPQNAIRYFERSKHYKKIEQFELALLDISDAIKLEPENTDYYSFRADLYDNHLNKNDLAIYDYEFLINADDTLNCDDVDNLILLGTIYEESNDLTIAHAYFNEGIKLSISKPLDRSWCLYHKALIALKFNQVDSALTFNNQAIQLNPNEAAFEFQNAEIFLNYKNDAALAEKHIKSAIKLSPDNITYLFTKSLISYRKNEIKEAIKELNKIIQIDPENSEAYCTRAMMELHIGELKKSESDLKSAKMKKNSDQNLNLYWAKYYNFLNDTLNYIEKLMDYIEVDPKDPEPYFLLANLYFSTKNWNKASIYYATCITLLEGSKYYISDNLGYPIHIAKIYSAIGDYCKAIGEFDIMYTYYEKAIDSIDTFTFELTELNREIQEKLSESCGKECTITPTKKYK